MCQSSRALEKRAEENTWVSTWTGKQLVENKGSREATPESHGVPWRGGGSWSAMMTAREELERATSRCKISRRRRSLHAQRAEGRVKRTRPDWMMLETRSQKLGRGQRTVYEQAKTLEVQNTVIDDKKSGPTAGEKSISNSRTSNRVMSVMNRADNTGADSPDSAQRISSPSTRSPTSLS